MQEELDDDLMHLEGFGKGQCFANKAPQTLEQRVVEALDVVGGPFGIRSAMLGGSQDVVVAFQMIGA